MRKPETFLFAIVLLLALTHTVPAQEDANQTLPFDSFGDLKSDDAGARMDNWAVPLGATLPDPFASPDETTEPDNF